jgi:xylulokinase
LLEGRAILVIGCDVGTQSTKALLLNDQGTTLARSARTYPTAHPAAGWAEQDPADWLDAVVGSISDLLGAADVGASDIAGIGVAAQVDGIAPVDAANRPVAKAPIWMDRRATAELANATRHVDAGTIRSITGLNADPSHGAAKIAWLRDHVETAVDGWLTPAGFIVAALTGRRTIDPTNASSLLLLDVETGSWSAALLDAFGVNPEALGSLLPSTDVAGGLLSDVADACGLAAGTPVIVGSGDEHAACVAANVLAPGIVADIVGTAEPVAAAAAQPIRDPEGLVETHAHAAPGAWLVEHPGFVSAGSVRWLAELLDVSQTEVLRLAADAPAGAAGVRFIPALGGAMTPRWNAAMQGAFTGLAIRHDRRHIARAVLEGCAFAVADIVERLAALGLGGDTVRVVGGGARDRTWLQIKADVTERRLELLCEPEATALGAALLAAVGIGWFPDLQAASAAALRLDPVPVEPDPGRAAQYRAARAETRAAFDALEPLAGAAA